MIKVLTPVSCLALGLCLFAGAAAAQSSSTSTAAANPAKKELVGKLLKLQQPGIEALARNLAEQPAAQLLDQASLFLQTRVPADKRAALAQDIEKDVQAYTREAVPLVRDRALQLAPSTAGKVLEERLSVDELRQIIALLESPVYAKYLQLNGEMQQALVEPLVAQTRAAIDPKLKNLDESVGKRLNAAASPAPAAAGGR